MAAGETDAADETNDVQPDDLADALTAIRLFACDPIGLGGLWLRCDDLVFERLRPLIDAALPPAMARRRVPLAIDDDRLLGGIDIGASLAAGRPVRVAGLIEEAAGGLLILRGAGRMDEALAARLAQALDARQVALLLVDDGRAGEAEGDDPVPPAPLTDRLAFHIDLRGLRTLHPAADADPALSGSAAGGAMPPADDATLTALAGASIAFGIASGRAPLLALRAAAAAAALAGRDAVARDDALCAARLVLGPRATQLPPAEPDDAADPPPEPPESSDPPDDPPESEDQPAPELPLEDLVLDAVRASLPPELFERLAAERRRMQGGQRGRGARGAARRRGRPVGVRPGLPRAATGWRWLRRCAWPRRGSGCAGVCRAGRSGSRARICASAGSRTGRRC
ncbi:hypothetical protein [Sphingomonas changnyeongensis]|uniref:hypothetical protein n=1 Tax=Sphingomonas changnyeongensis TaxID=2698679 RepID=UPI001E287696|nr:hypothetical protein [Sphingomonas changnyeongensis]